MRMNPYLFFKGDCESALKHYQKVLGGKITAMLPHAGTPAEEHVPKEWRRKIIHACLEADDFILTAVRLSLQATKATPRASRSASTSTSRPRRSASSAPSRRAAR